jgi:hypothetical protein
MEGMATVLSSGRLLCLRNQDSLRVPVWSFYSPRVWVELGQIAMNLAFCQQKSTGFDDSNAVDFL